MHPKKPLFQGCESAHISRGLHVSQAQEKVATD